ncbi:hypothetical protein [Brevibacillus sp. AF8]|uniref:hypothetical protein n=1 Tax=Brevibacillus sp. AF8 TaxID=2825881 RepID=UPI001E459C9A|nr:hypothetical protein [Brevibacillus sp. AF8]MCE0450053.1 hypothetical protein [Brevibacillus sp. AF8]
MGSESKRSHEYWALVFSLSVLIICAFFLIYSIIHAILGKIAAGPLFALLMLGVTTFASIDLLRRVSPKTPRARFIKFICLIIYYSGFTIYMGLAISGGLFQLLIHFFPNFNWSVPTVVSIFLLVGLMYLFPLKLSWSNIQYLKDTKAAIFIVNALMLVMFEIKVIYPNIFTMGNELLHLLALPAFISSLTAISILEFKLASSKRSKRRYKVSRMSH